MLDVALCVCDARPAFAPPAEFAIDGGPRRFIQLLELFNAAINDDVDLTSRT
jgi:hypothetical protein